MNFGVESTMSFYRNLELLESPFSGFYGDACIWRSSVLPFSSPFLFEQDLLDFALEPPCPLNLSVSAADLIQIGAPTTLQRLQERAETEIYLKNLSDRVTALELGFNGGILRSSPLEDRKYTWTSETKGSSGRKYKVEAEATAKGERNLKFTAEVKDKDKVLRKCTFEKSSTPAVLSKNKEKVVREKKSGTRLVEISEGADQGAIVLRQVDLSSGEC